MTQEEAEAYESLISLPGEFDTSETILIKLKEIEHSKDKFQLWMFSYDFDDQIENFEEHINAYIKSFDVVKNSKTLRKILSYTLTIGNILNGGSNKGQADGFTLDSLTKLVSIKDCNNKSLLQNIAIRLKNEDENFGNIRREFELCEEAVKVPLSETTTGIDKLKAYTKNNVETLKKLEKVADDNFMKKIKKIVLANEERINKLSSQVEDSKNVAVKTIEFFGYPKSDIKYKKPDDLLVLISDFAKELDKAIPQTEAKKAFKGAQPMGKKITEKNTSLDSVLSGLKQKMASK